MKRFLIYAKGMLARLGKYPVPGLVLWLVVLAAAAIPAVYMNNIFGYLPVLMYSMLSLLSLLMMLWTAKRVKVEAEDRTLECRRGSSAALGLRIVSRTRLCCPRAEAELYISDLFGGDDSIRKLHLMLKGRDSLDLRMNMDMTHIGVYTMGFSSVEVYGLFGVLKKRLPAGGRVQALVLPRIRPLDDLQLQEEVTGETDRDRSVTVAGGTDYTGVREYTLGDPMKQIHWKLSAHARTYMTKLQESSRQQEFEILLDLTAEKNENREQLMDLNDGLIETALSLAEYLSDMDAGYTLAYPDRSGSIVRMTPQGREDDAELIRSILPLSQEPGPEIPDGAQLLRETGEQHSQRTNVIMVSSRIIPELADELIRTKSRRVSPMLFMVHPAEWSRREIQDHSLPARRLEEAGIPYFRIPAGLGLKLEDTEEKAGEKE